jgi:hypothetical protein
MSDIKDFSSIKSILAKSLFDTLLSDCNPPPDRLDIPVGSIRQDEQSPGWAFATVTYVVFCPGKKVHTVRIRYQYTPEGKFLLGTMSYV